MRLPFFMPSNHTEIIGFCIADQPGSPSSVNSHDRLSPNAKPNTEPDLILNVTNGNFYSCRTVCLGPFQAGG